MATIYLVLEVGLRTNLICFNHVIGFNAILFLLMENDMYPPQLPNLLQYESFERNLTGDFLQLLLQIKRIRF